MKTTADDLQSNDTDDERLNELDIKLCEVELSGRSLEERIRGGRIMTWSFVDKYSDYGEFGRDVSLCFFSATDLVLMHVTAEFDCRVQDRRFDSTFKSNAECCE